MILKAEFFPFGDSNFFLQFTNGRPLYLKAHSHEFYEANFVSKGGFSQIVNGKKIICRKNSLLLLRPNDTHKIISQLPNTNIISFSIKTEHLKTFSEAYGSFITSLINDSSFPPFVEFDPLANKYINDSNSTLTISNNEEKEMYYNMILGEIFHSIAVQHNWQETSSTGFSQAAATLYSALEQMNDQKNIAEGLPALQRISGYSKSHLCRLMKKYIGKTPQEYIMDKKINLSYNMVMHTCLSIADIAEKSGFSSESHFISTFKKEFGITPAQKRKEDSLLNH